MGGGGQIVACAERVIIAGCTLACSRFTSTDDFAAANIPQNGGLVMILWLPNALSLFGVRPKIDFWLPRSHEPLSKWHVDIRHLCGV